ncbi:MAG: DnaK suppressor protein [Halioglobus sp.]|jgi:DnaK suppressor protein
MEKTQLDAFRQALISLKEELEQLTESSKEAGDTVTLDQSAVGRLSRMDAMQAQQMAQETARRRQLQLQKIEGALRRMDAGEYGYCVICEEDIGQARLNFDPSSTRCIGCMDD